LQIKDLYLEAKMFEHELKQHLSAEAKTGKQELDQEN